MRNYTKSCYLFDILWQKNRIFFLQILISLNLPVNLKTFIPGHSFLVCPFFYKDSLKDLHTINQLLCHISMNCIWVWELHIYRYILKCQSCQKLTNNAHFCEHVVWQPIAHFQWPSIFNSALMQNIIEDKRRKIFAICMYIKVGFIYTLWYSLLSTSSIQE